MHGLRADGYRAVRGTLRSGVPVLLADDSGILLLTVYLR